MSFDFQQTQREFSERIRKQQENPIPEGISERRMQVYETGFFKTVNEAVSKCFPLLKNILGEEKWTQLVKTFYADHESKTPYFYEIPQEFLTYFFTANLTYENLPFLKALAHFEWMELVIEISPEMTPSPFKEQEDFSIEDVFLKASPVSELVAYDFPVHCVTQDTESSTFETRPTYVCFYRYFDESVKWVEFTVIEARLFQLLKENPMTGNEVINILQKECKSHLREYLSDECFQVLRSFLKNGIIYY